MAVAQSQLASIEQHWPEQRQRRVDAASHRLAGDLHAAYHRAERLAEAAAATAGRRPGSGVRATRPAGAHGRARNERRDPRRRRDAVGLGRPASASPDRSRRFDRLQGDWILRGAGGQAPHPGRASRGGRGPHLGPPQRYRTAAGAWPSSSGHVPRSASGYTLPTPLRTSPTYSTTRNLRPQGRGSSSASSPSRRSRAARRSWPTSVGAAPSPGSCWSCSRLD